MEYRAGLRWASRDVGGCSAPSVAFRFSFLAAAAGGVGGAAAAFAAAAGFAAGGAAAAASSATATTTACGVVDDAGFFIEEVEGGVALAELAHEFVHDEVEAAVGGGELLVNQLDEDAFLLGAFVGEVDEGVVGGVALVEERGFCGREAVVEQGGGQADLGDFAAEECAVDAQVFVRHEGEGADLFVDVVEQVGVADDGGVGGDDAVHVGDLKLELLAGEGFCGASAVCGGVALEVEGLYNGDVARVGVEGIIEGGDGGDEGDGGSGPAVADGAVHV